MKYIDRDVQLASLIKNDYFLFSGERATCGKAHPKTGNSDNYGETFRFRAKVDAIKFCNSLSHAEIQKVGKASTMRKYHLGASVSDFNEFLNHLEYAA